jgi:hypothetical protein
MTTQQWLRICTNNRDVFFLCLPHYPYSPLLVRCLLHRTSRSTTIYEYVLEQRKYGSNVLLVLCKHAVRIIYINIVIQNSLFLWSSFSIILHKKKHACCFFHTSSYNNMQIVVHDVWILRKRKKGNEHDDKTDKSKKINLWKLHPLMCSSLDFQGGHSWSENQAFSSIHRKH